MTGLDRIKEVFSRKRIQGRAALMPYFTLGFPTRAASLGAIEAIASAGADLIELGIPFSDPLADGPTIQHSAQVALQNGMTVKDCLHMVAELRGHRLIQPLMLMGYYNPILAYGLDKFVEDAAHSGADGLIVPDLPLEEADDLETACRRAGLALVYLIAPTSPSDRLAQIAGRSTGFLYIVSLVGVTGARSEVSVTLPDFLDHVREHTSLPIAVGFGISTPSQASEVGKLADGVIVGSALIDAVDHADDPVRAAGDFIARLSRALAGIGPSK